MKIQGHNIYVTVFATAIEEKTAQESMQELSIWQHLTTRVTTLQTLWNSAVQIVFFHFESNIGLLFEISNRIVFAVLKVRMLNSFFLKCELQLLKFELNSKFVY